tara:strand:+ start:1100 stop:1474 length:375 start_codon:yes stop_codon:yes gene_type:complete
MPLIDLSTIVEDKTDEWVKNIGNAHFKNLSIEDTKHVLSKMGKVMSMRKVGRKIGLMATLIYEVQIGETFTSEALNLRSRKYITDKMSLTNDSVGAILRLFKKWGVVQRELKLLNNRVTYIRVK